MENTIPLNWLIELALLAPLASFIVCFFIPDRYSWVVPILAIILLFISVVSSFCIFLSMPAHETYLLRFDWFSMHAYTLQANLELNRLSIIMLPLVSGISFLIHLYSLGYMAGDIGIKRYFAMLGFFTFSMLGIVLSDNLLVIFVFWELVGFSSYLLIGHWKEKPEAAKAAQKAFLFNRIGDAGFLVGVMIIWSNTQTLNLNEILLTTELSSWQTIASLCIFCGVIGKSAQLPLLTWLPDAMEGPTPVSALIHAATMVAAGVFLLARVFPLFTFEALHVVAITGSLTAFIAALFALHQFDIKKILAYSTISQLGFMVTAVGTGSENAAMVHLVTHACFKACLFLGAGSVIHALHQAQQQTHQSFDVQDIRTMGGLRKKLPTTFLTFLLAAASLSGIPFFSGFLSKDSIIADILTWSGQELSWRIIILIMSVATSFLTTLYCFRMVWYIFFANENERTSTAMESPWIMRIPMVILALLSIWWVISWNPFVATGWFTNRVGALPHHHVIILLSTGVVSLGLLTGWFLFVRKSEPKAAPILQQGLYLDNIYKNLVGRTTIILATTSERIDRVWIDGVLHFIAYTHASLAHFIAWCDRYIVDGLVKTTAWATGKIGSFTRSFQSGKIQLYIFWAMAGLIIFLFFLLI
ncbi:MAG: NADH-quinone oxidoreductase subunit L [Cyclobacteriaceae bacterium]